MALVNSNTLLIFILLLIPTVCSVQSANTLVAIVVFGYFYSLALHSIQHVQTYSIAHTFSHSIL